MQNGLSLMFNYFNQTDMSPYLFNTLDIDDDKFKQLGLYFYKNNLRHLVTYILFHKYRYFPDVRAKIPRNQPRLRFIFHRPNNVNALSRCYINICVLLFNFSIAILYNIWRLLRLCGRLIRISRLPRIPADFDGCTLNRLICPRELRRNILVSQCLF